MSKWSVVWEASLVRVTRRQRNLWQSVQLDYQREVLTQELEKKNKNNKVTHENAS